MSYACVQDMRNMSTPNPPSIGTQAEFLRGLMVAYKEWGYQLYPGVAFEDLASRTEKLGGRARTRDLMRELRDAERDRVLEAKYGREAVDDVHAQEAARLAAKESKTAAAEADGAEEREDEELAGSRYAMEVDGDGGDEGKSDRQVAPAEGSAAAMSEQVRQRIEANRRLALDRLRLKKQEAAAAALAAETENGGGGVAMPAADDGSRQGEDLEEDLMDVDGDGGPGDSFDDDEAALADIEAEEMAARPVAAAASRGKKSVAEPGSAVVSTPPASALAVEGEETAGAVDEETASPEPTIREDEAMEDAGTSASGANTADAVADDGDDPAPASVVADGVARGEARGAGAGCAGSVDEASATRIAAAAGGGEPGTTAGEESGGELPPASEPGAPAPGVGDGQERDGANDEAASLRTPAPAAAASAGADGTAEGAKIDGAVLGGGDGGGGAPEPVATKGDEEGASFSSPAKCRAAAAGGLPLSPLGSLFAGTDVSAEGGLAVAREPLGGLFPDENV